MKPLQNEAIEFALSRAESSIENANAWLRIAKESLKLPSSAKTNQPK